jgi:hypothetical protein
MNLTAVVVNQIIFKLYRMLSRKIQVPKFMLEMVMVAQQQILMLFSKKGSADHAVQTAGS